MHGGGDAGLDAEILGALSCGVERTFDQDPALALRVLADIALRALSSSLNDPTTATQALDGIDALLRSLAVRDPGAARVRDADGTLRVVLRLPTWDEYVAVALDEVTAAPTDSPLVPRRIRRLLENVLAIAPPDRRAVVEWRIVQLPDPGR